MSNIEFDKNRIRKQIREQRKLLSPDELKAADKRLFDEFKNALMKDKDMKRIFDKSKYIAVYKGVRGELPCDMLCEYLRSLGKHTCYPRTIGNDMVFCDINDPSTQLVKGQFGLLEPDENIASVDNKDISIMIMPGIAYDEEGYRVGQGGGYYDRFIADLTNEPLLVGVCMSFQLMSLVPIESTDIPADVVLCV
ncbi:MAG: 5-formyltetrahydrofolate cyclo-ligase [Saccharofermentans sp.]|nr:5-formyltetrahydrofolate cyclo-ligase [Saccharofermentans sp.]